MKPIDLRSDTVTLPSPEMREAIAAAEVGDDVYGEDPSINALQDKVAKILGKEASLFVASGSMGNGVSIKTLTQPGDEVIIESSGHIVKFEAGSAAMLSGVMLKMLEGSNGILTAEQIEPAINPINVHSPPTTVISLENTHNSGGGTVYPLEEIQRIHAVAKKHGIRMHLDGARLWNASVATGIAMKEYAQYFDTVSVCFSKGLGAPVGSMIAGSREIIKIAHKNRKVFGGGMRQAGFLAAAAQYAVDHNVQRLAEDHRNARLLAEGISSLPGISVDLKTVQTNIIYIQVDQSRISAHEIVKALNKKNILILALGSSRIRAVTHLNVSREEILQSIEAFTDLLGKS